MAGTIDEYTNMYAGASLTHISMPQVDGNGRLCMTNVFVASSGGPIGAVSALKTVIDFYARSVAGYEHGSSLS